MNEPTKDKEAASESAAAEEPLDWENRRLCSDGNCIGVIGPDGRCKECGRSEEGRPEAAEPLEPRPAVEAEAERPAGGPEPPEPSVDDWDNRRLCSDGNCIGVIGSDGRCKECGKPAA